MIKAARHFVRFFPVRAILAALILCSMVALVLPLSSASAASSCQLDCCAGRAPHAAGSCMSGACHARIKNKRPAHTHLNSTEKSEELCGLSSRPLAIARRVAASNVSAHRTINSKSPQSELSATAAGRPCPQDCGGLASGFATAKQSRKVVFRPDQSLRPQSVIGSNDFFIQSVKSRAGLRRRSIPRGPPPSFA